jgi:hypothetical protein
MLSDKTKSILKKLKNSSFKVEYNIIDKLADEREYKGHGKPTSRNSEYNIQEQQNYSGT